MNEKTLKTYDIASYEIELDYNKKISPIEKAIQKLNSAHEAKSLKAHKDFLSKENKSKTALNQLQEKSLLKHQRIERAVENKLAKLEPRLNRYDQQLEEFITERRATADADKAIIDATIAELKKEEQQRIDEIKTKYKTNIESYVEKLDIYNNNYENNKTEHAKQINQYQDLLNQHIATVKQFYDDVVTDLDTKLKTYENDMVESDKQIDAQTKDTIRVLNNLSTTIRKQANINLTGINDYVDQLKAIYSEHYGSSLEKMERHIQTLQDRFEEREALIKKDLEINLAKLEVQLAELPEDADKKIRRSIEQKLDLFQLRAATTLRYEQRLLDQQLLLLEQERKEMEQREAIESSNLEKLRVFFINDETTRKDVGDHYKDIDIALRTELDTFEHKNNEYILKHEHLKADFIREYTRIFTELKQATIDLAQSYLEKIAENNQVMDEINKFIDTSDPLKEIEVNRLREEIEINEMHERYQIKFAKQQYELDRIDALLAHDIRLAEIDHMEQVSEYNTDVAEIRSKEVFDKAVEQAKLKQKKADHAYSLRKNNIRLERRLLSSKFKTESGIYDHKKKLAEIDVRKTNALRGKELVYAIANIKMEADYQVEVIQKRLEEDLMQLDERLTKLRYEKNAYKASITQDIESYKLTIQERRREVEQSFNDKLDMIDKALERELKQPTKNKIKTEAVVDERLSKFDLNNAIFTDYISHAIDSFQDDKLSLEQIQEVITNNDSIQEKAMKYMDRAIQVLLDAILFMRDIDERNVMNQITATSDQGKIKRLQRQVDKIHQDRDKELAQVQQLQTDHKTALRLAITEEIELLKRSNPTDVDDMLHQTDLGYNKILSRLATIQADIKSQVVDLYSPLTNADTELIDHATKNAAKAKEKVNQERSEAVRPLEEELAAYIESKHNEQATQLAQLDDDINGLKAQINQFKNDALAKTKDIQTERDERINAQALLQQELEANEDQDITRAIEDIDRSIAKLQADYEQAEQRLTAKEAEATKIFDYEESIYNIAVDSATSRYNDAIVKSKSVHLNNLQQYKSMREQTALDKTKTETDLDQTLLDLTKQFEQNIFSVRPRLEESIGDAQKQIDNQIAEKVEHLTDLKQTNERLIASAELRLYTAYQEGTDKLSDNLQNYIEKYRLIEEEYDKYNQGVSDRIRTNSVRFGNGLIELHQAKHANTLEQLLAINAEMFGKGE